MALDKTRLSLAIKTALLAGGIANNEVDPANPLEDPPLTQVCDAIADAVIDEILNNLDIEVPALTYIETVTPPAVGVQNILAAACTVA